jgi:hypothetical protein
MSDAPSLQNHADAKVEASTDVGVSPPVIADPLTVDLTCPGCGKVSPVNGDPAKLLIRCSCGARVAYGTLMPKVVVSPHPEDARFCVVQTETKDGQRVTITLDNDLWAQVAHNIASICPRGRS